MKSFLNVLAVSKGVVVPFQYEVNDFDDIRLIREQYDSNSELEAYSMVITGPLKINADV